MQPTRLEMHGHGAAEPEGGRLAPSFLVSPRISLIRGVSSGPLAAIMGLLESIKPFIPSVGYRDVPPTLLGDLYDSDEEEEIHREDEGEPLGEPEPSGELLRTDQF
eukprot:GABV01009940.1.p2 GENE.GABV01009940.1~~GABV01009940.1.p2  ORF type:complete len:106 (-),score=25.35 GABV01009940.1:2-319(-)